MAVDFYTHKFTFEIDGVLIKGDVEFDTDQKASIHIKESSEPLCVDILKHFYEMMEWCHEVYEDHTGVSKKFKLKVVPIGE